MPADQLVLAVEIDGDGAHPAAWRRAAHAPRSLLDPRRVRTIARITENAGFGLVTLADDLVPPGATPNINGRIGAVERAAFIAAVTSVVGIAPVVSTTYAEPFHVSSQLASIDHVSNGRAGWVAGVSAGEEAARAWGRPLVGDASARSREARDSARVVRALWDSWEDDAVIRDVATSRYLDRDRLHYIDFTGETFAVKGPAIVPRPPQGQLVVFAEHGLIPSDLVDVALVDRPELAARTDAPRTFVEIEVALDTPAASAADRVAELDRFTAFPARNRLRFTGSAEGFVALLTELAGVVDGVRLHPFVLDDDLAVLSRRVLPALFRARIASRPLPGTTLRDTLGLARPDNRHAAAQGIAR